MIVRFRQEEKLRCCVHREYTLVWIIRICRHDAIASLRVPAAAAIASSSAAVPECIAWLPPISCYSPIIALNVQCSTQELLSERLPSTHPTTNIQYQHNLSRRALNCSSFQMVNFEDGMPTPYIPKDKNVLYVRPAGGRMRLITHSPAYRTCFSLPYPFLLMYPFLCMYPFLFACFVFVILE